jgi:hypothetical protein
MSIFVQRQWHMGVGAFVLAVMAFAPGLERLPGARASA